MMDEVTAIGTAWSRVGGRARVSAVMVYAALLMLQDESSPAAQISLAKIEEASGCSMRSITRSLRDLERLRAVEVDRNHASNVAHSYRHTWQERRDSRA
jgi:hypothetical protein